MSIHITSRVWSKSQHRGTALLLLLALADMANDEGECYPSQTTLAKRAKITVRNVQAQLKALEDSGEITRLLHMGPSGVNRYRINLSALGKNADDNTVQEPLPDIGFGTPEELRIEHPSETSGRNVKESSNKPIGSDLAPFALWRMLCESIGTDPSALKGGSLGRQLAVAKRMIGQNPDMTLRDYQTFMTWLSSNAWLRDRGIDLFVAERELSKWLLAGKPSAFNPRTGKEKAISGSTPRG